MSPEPRATAKCNAEKRLRRPTAWLASSPVLRQTPVRKETIPRRRTRGRATCRRTCGKAARPNWTCWTSVV